MLDVNVNIKLNGVVGSVGFGVPLILVSKATGEIPFSKYSDIADVLKAGYAKDSKAYQLFEIMKEQENCPKWIGIAQTEDTAVNALPALRGKVRQIITVLGETGDSTVTEVAKYVETTNDMTYFPIVSSSTDLSTLAGLDRTMAGVHSGGQKVAAGLVGATAGYNAGEFTYKNIIIKGVTPDDLTDSEVSKINNETNAETAYGYTIQTKAGDVVTTEGKTASGEYLDITDSFDWIRQNIAYKCQKAFNSMPKFPYDNRGIGPLEGITNGVLAEADLNGIIAHDDNGDALYSTDFGSREEAQEIDRQNRVYKLGRFSFQLAGAIHTAEINGTVTV